MHVTIRQYLMRRCSQTVTATIVFLLVAGYLVSVGPALFEIRFALSVVSAAVVLAAFWSLFKLPCPRCGHSLGRVGFWVANGGTPTATAHCPHCAVSVDAPLRQ
jgi:hypothetical protein